MNETRINGYEMYTLFALGAFTGIAILSLVLATCLRFWIAAEASLVFAVALVAEAGYVGAAVLRRADRGDVGPRDRRQDAPGGF